jgi:hypothetical protein
MVPRIRGARVLRLMTLGLGIALATGLAQPLPAAAYTSSYVPVHKAGNSLCIDDPNASKTSGTQMILWPCATGSNQQWREMSVECGLGGGPLSSTCALLQNAASGLCLDVKGGSKSNGTPAIQWPCNTSDHAQWFKVMPAAGGSGPPYWTLWAAGIGVCLDDPNNSSTSGTKLRFWQCNQSAAQIWYAPGWAAFWP